MEVRDSVEIWFHGDEYTFRPDNGDDGIPEPEAAPPYLLPPMRIGPELAAQASLLPAMLHCCNSMGSTYLMDWRVMQR